MIFQTLTTSWILGIGVMFGLSLMMTIMTYKDVDTFFIFLSIFSGFTVWSGLLPLWVMVFSIIITMLILVNKVNKKRM